MGVPAGRGPVTWVASVTPWGAAGRSRRSARVSGVMRASWGAGPGTGGIGGVTLAWRRAASSCNKESWLEKYQEIKNNRGKQQ